MSTCPTTVRVTAIARGEFAGAVRDPACTFDCPIHHHWSHKGNAMSEETQWDDAAEDHVSEALTFPPIPKFAPPPHEHRPPDFDSGWTGALASPRPAGVARALAIRPIHADASDWDAFLGAMAPLPSTWDANETSRQFGLWAERIAYDWRQRCRYEEQRQREAEDLAANPPPPTDQQRIATLEAKLIELTVRLATLEAREPRQPARVGRISPRKSPSAA